MLESAGVGAGRATGLAALGRSFSTGHFQPKQHIAGARRGTEGGRSIVLVALGQAEDQLVAVKLIDSFQHFVELRRHVDFRRDFRWVESDRREPPLAALW